MEELFFFLALFGSPTDVGTMLCGELSLDFWVGGDLEVNDCP